MKTKLEILNSRYEREKGHPMMPDSYGGRHVDPTRSDNYAENLIGKGNYVDTGCNLAPKCLECPFEDCLKDQANEVTRLERNARIWRDYTRLQRYTGDGTIAKIAKDFQVSVRTVNRAVKMGKQGQLDGIKTREKVDTHKLLTKGIFKERTTLPSLRSMGA